MSPLRSLFVAGLLSLPAAAQANLVANGSFETPLLAPGVFATFFTGQVIGSAWTVVGAPGVSGSVAVIGGSYTESGVNYPAQNGLQWLDLTGPGSNSAVGVEQALSTTASLSYALSFAVGNVNQPGIGLGSSSTVELFVNGSSAGLFTNSAGGATAINWQVFNTSFTATGASTTLRFINRDGPNDGVNGLDNVIVEARTGVVPVPAALPLLASGLALFGFLGRRRTTSR